MKQPTDPREYMAGLEKGLAVVETFSPGREKLSVTEVAQAVGLSRAAARRCLLTLQHLGYASFDGKYYRLAPRCLRLGHAYISSNPLARLVQPVLEAASERTGESMAAAVLDADAAVVIARTSIRRSLSEGLAVGARLPVYCSAIGRVLLAALPSTEAQAILTECHKIKLTPKTKIGAAEIMTDLKRTRSTGYAINDQEVELGLLTIAVSVTDRNGNTQLGMSVSTSTQRSSVKHLVAQLLPELEIARSKVASIIGA
jgi:IclR family pca regulon transcriptional regulator